MFRAVVFKSPLAGCVAWLAVSTASAAAKGQLKNPYYDDNAAIVAAARTPPRTAASLSENDARRV